MPVVAAASITQEQSREQGQGDVRAAVCVPVQDGAGEKARGGAQGPLLWDASAQAWVPAPDKPKRGSPAGEPGTASVTASAGTPQA